MCEAVGLTVKALHRYGYGPLQIGMLPKGAARPLHEGEVRKLRAVASRPGGVARRAVKAGPSAPDRPHRRDDRRRPPRRRERNLGQRTDAGGFRASRARRERPRGAPPRRSRTRG